MLQSAVLALAILSIFHTHESSSSMTCLRGSCFHSEHTALMPCVEMAVMYHQTFVSQVTCGDSWVCPTCWLVYQFLILILMPNCCTV